MYDRILKIGDGMGGQQSMLAETLPPRHHLIKMQALAAYSRKEHQAIGCPCSEGGGSAL